VVNSEGFILQNPNNADEEIGFTREELPDVPVYTQVNFGLKDTSEDRELGSTSSGGDFNFIQDTKDGLIGLGLWVYDLKQTAKKLKNSDYSLDSILAVETGTPYLTSVYNVTDINRNPVYKLCAKKVFGLKGLLSVANGSKITIIWNINF